MIQGNISANNDALFKQLIAKIVRFYAQHLNNQHWGEQIAFNSDNTISIGLVYVSANKNLLEKTWAPLIAWLNKHKSDYKQKIQFFPIAPDKLYDYDFWHINFPNNVVKNKAKSARPGQFWWASNTGEVNRYWYIYQSWWLPIRLFEKQNQKKLSRTIFKASQLATVSFHINKGLSGVSEDALQRGLQTSVNPTVNKAAALLIMSAGNDHLDKKKGMDEAAKISRAIQLFTQLALNSGAYANEADYFQKNWQEAFWGINYPALLKIKRQYHPSGLFYCHHCVGSEFWTSDGMCKTSAQLVTAA